MNTELPEGYIPSEDEEYMNPLQREYFRRKLIQWKKDLIKDSIDMLNSLKNDIWYSADPNDLAALEIDQSNELRSKNRQLKLMTEIDAALQKLELDENGECEFGFCEESGQIIGIGRLDARPIATLCIEEQEKLERYQRQHSEE